MIHFRHLGATALVCWSFVSVQALAQEKDTVGAHPSAFQRYPAEAKQAGLEGNVTVRIFINEQGD
jgi:outer membrane biosynthesis protein TonB